MRRKEILLLAGSTKTQGTTHNAAERVTAPAFRLCCWASSSVVPAFCDPACCTWRIAAVHGCTPGNNNRVCKEASIQEVSAVHLVCPKSAPVRALGRGCLGLNVRKYFNDSALLTVHCLLLSSKVADRSAPYA